MNATEQLEDVAKPPAAEELIAFEFTGLEHMLQAQLGHKLYPLAMSTAAVELRSISIVNSTALYLFPLPAPVGFDSVDLFDYQVIVPSHIEGRHGMNLSFDL